MSYAKIVVKNNYEKRGDIVLRSYIRALKLINADKLLKGDNAIIYGIIEEDGKFHELFTKELIDYEYYDFASEDDLNELGEMPLSQMYEIKKIIEHVIFGKDVDLDIEISSIDELARDRAIEFDAYNSFLSRVNPYMRLDDQECYNAYNNFAVKIREAKKIRELDRMEDFDEYDLRVYENTSRSIGRK